MNKQDELQDAVDEAEFLRKRSWDFIDRLEKLENEHRKLIDVEKRQSLQTRIKNTRHLLEDYKVQYKALCKEAGIPQESLSLNAPARDLVSSLSRKTQKTRDDLINNQDIELAPFFLVPARNPKFTGRKNEVSDFVQLVLAGGAFAICGVKGMGGIGKSEIAKEVCHLFHETWQLEPKLPEYTKEMLSSENSEGGFFHDGMLWIQFEQERQTPKSLTDYLIAKLIEPHQAENISDLEGLVNILEGKDILVVLDSVEQNLRTFDYVLERFKGRFPLIITSRIVIPGIHAIDINMLKDNEAQALFINHLETRELSEKQKKIVEELCQLLGNYPLIIKIIASRVKADNSNLSELKRAYQSNRALLLDEIGHDTGIEKRNADVKTCFMMSFNSLNNKEQEAFLHSALFDNPFTTSALSILLDSDNSDEKEIPLIVKRLQRLSLFNCLKGKDGQPPTYELHPLMREFALDLLTQKVPIIPGKKEEIKTLLESLILAEKQNTLMEQLQNRALVQQAADAMSYCDGVFDFASVLQFMAVLNDPINTLGYWDEKIGLNRLAVRSAVVLQDRRVEVGWRVQLNDTFQRKGFSSVEQEQARNMWEQALLTSKELKLKEKVLFSQYRLTDIDTTLQEWNAAVRNSYQGIREACRYDEVYYLGAFLKTLGVAHEHFADNQADLFYRINFKLKKANISQYWGICNLLSAARDMIDVLHKKGKFKSCIDYYQKNLQISQILDQAVSAANTIERLFFCYLHMQNQLACRDYLQRCKKSSRKLGLPESERQEKIGQFAWLSGDYVTAIESFSAALKENDLDQHNLYYWLGKTFLYQGDLDNAEDYLNRVLDHHRFHKNSMEMAKVHYQLALLALKRGQTRQAVQHLSTSLKTQEVHEVIASPEEVQIQQSIREQLTHEDAEVGLYEKLAAEAKPIDLKPDFLLSNLPQTDTGKDGKFMHLIPAGSVFIGKGEIERLSTQELLDNIEQYLYPYRQHNTEYQLPPHPDSLFDEDKLLFLLEKSSFLSSEEKQQIVDKTAILTQPAIEKLVSILAWENHAKNPKALEIYLYPYFIDRELVSNAEYQAFCLSSGHPFPTHWQDSKPLDMTEDLPIVNISLEDAKTYAKWAGKEIPTAAELEKAIRGEQGSPYPWEGEWDENQVKVKDGNIRRQFEAEYRELNANIPDSGGMVNFKTPRFTLPAHELELDEDLFLSYLQGSISLTFDEKRRIVEKFAKLTQAQIDELLRILTEEKSKFLSLDKKHQPELNRHRKRYYISHMQSELAESYLTALKETRQNKSTYGVLDLVGSVSQMTVSEIDGEFIIKGGSWFSENPEIDCQAWTEEKISPSEKRMDMGFRCVKPIFSKEDLT